MDQRQKLIRGLREAALEIKSKKNYHWGHMGKCNCGFLAQKLSNFSSAEIHKMAMAGTGDWNEQLQDYCPSSGYPMDRLIFDLLQFGLKLDELAHLERLSDPKILKETKKIKAYLIFNEAEDVALYMNTWAFLLEKEMVPAMNGEVYIMKGDTVDALPGNGGRSFTETEFSSTAAIKALIPA